MEVELWPVAYIKRLSQKHFTIRSRSIQVPDKFVLKSLAGGRELLSQPLQFLLADWRKTPSNLHVLLEHFDLWHSHHSCSHRQTHGVTQQGIHVGLSGTVAQEKLLAGHLHGNDTQVLFVCGRKRQVFEPAIAGGIQSHLHT